MAEDGGGQQSSLFLSGVYLCSSVLPMLLACSFEQDTNGVLLNSAPKRANGEGGVH